ncbi:MAG: SDR family NAD(P)-dependent oxidoreductase [Bacteroidetes bacterium]|nr:SDR family NAD(P)-dependent oxidoreductase [Bacteroidota bacterium]MBL0096052.1 SDR family NAD(P)-dependent oxidoreductase [Bacteroidota bacterium]
MKKAIVVGGTSGIGKALVELLLEKNYSVGLCGIERDDLTLLKNANPQHLIIKFIDCGKENCSGEINTLVNDLGGMDLLVFSAGIGHLNKDIGYTVENPANKVNVLGFTEVVDWGYRYFHKQGSGHLVGISSVAGLFGFRTTPAYTAAKGYQINYLEALRQKAHRSKFPLFVTDIRPGFVDTEMTSDKKKFWSTSTHHAAQLIYKAILHKKGIAYVKPRWWIVGFAVKFIPNWLRSRL